MLHQVISIFYLLGVLVLQKSSKLLYVSLDLQKRNGRHRKSSVPRSPTGFCSVSLYSSTTKDAWTLPKTLCLLMMGIIDYHSDAVVRKSSTHSDFARNDRDYLLPAIKEQKCSGYFYFIYLQWTLSITNSFLLEDNIDRKEGTLVF